MSPARWRNWREAPAGQRGEVPERPTLVVGQHSLYDRTRAPEGGSTLYVYGHVPSSYDVPDEEIADHIQAQLERFAPGFGSAVRARSFRSPAETERESPSLVGGDLAGGSMELDQLLVFRPAQSSRSIGRPCAGCTSPALPFTPAPPFTASRVAGPPTRCSRTASAALGADRDHGCRCVRGPTASRRLPLETS